MSRNLCKKIPAFLLANVLYTAFLVASLSAYSTASTYQYPLSCNDCHGMPPIDAAYRNTSSGGFKGSHLTHNPPSVAPKEACEKCHPGSSIYTSGHMNGFINLTSNINSSPHLSKATYSKARFFNQTSNPIMATCSNVNCHFENTTSTWGSDPGETTCSTCHEAPPTDGSHLPHLAFACVACHPDHTVETQPFSHATSVGSRPILLQFVTAPNSGGEYSGNVSYPYYLSSKDPARNGTCQNIYCHSNGRGGTANVSPVWGGMLAVNCSGCHGTSSAFGAPGYPNGLPHANSHGKHVHSAADCDACHTGTTTSGTVINSGSLLHLDGGIDVTFNSAKAGSGATWTAGTSTCSAISCHSDGTSVATGEITAGGSLVWGGGGGFTCNSCHGFPPAYVNGLPKANSHLSHSFSCNTCHAGTTANGTNVTDTVLHVNKGYNVAPGAGVSFTYAFAATGGTCSNISCHNNGTATWGTTLTCGDCHIVSPGGD